MVLSLTVPQGWRWATRSDDIGTVVGGMSMLHSLWERKLNCFIKMNRSYLPTWPSLAFDYLAIMGSSVPSEHAFSAAGITISKCWNCLKADLVEALEFHKCMYVKDPIYREPVKGFTLLCSTWAVVIVTDLYIFALASTRGMSEKAKWDKRIRRRRNEPHSNWRTPSWRLGVRTKVLLIHFAKGHIGLCYRTNSQSTVNPIQQLVVKRIIMNPMHHQQTWGE